MKLTCNICGEELEALVHTDTELHPDDAADGLYLHKFNGGIPQDFLDIDDNEDHWTWGEYDGKPFVVPSTDTSSDMTDAMMGEVPGQDDTVTPLKLTERRFYKFCMAFLMQDGNLDVPGGRYGRDTRDCATVAITMALVMRYHNGEPISYYSLNSDMGQVVNSADGVTELLSESSYIFDKEDGINIRELLGDAFEPQTPLEKLAQWAEEHGGLLAVDESDEDDGRPLRITIMVDEDEAETLVDLVQGKFLPGDD